MAKRLVNNFTPEWFEQRGYTPDGKGGYNSPKFINPLNKIPISVFKQSNEPDIIPNKYSKIEIGEPIVVFNKNLLTKQKVNNSPDFEVKSVTEWFVPYQVPSKKNCQQLYIKTISGGRQVPSSTTSDRYKQYVTLTKKYWEVFGIEFNQTIKRLNLCYPLYIEFTFVRSTMQRMDYLGPLESVQDIMTDFGWILDDDYKHLKPFLGDIEVDKNSPGVRIKLIIDK